MTSGRAQKMKLIPFSALTLCVPLLLIVGCGSRPSGQGQEGLQQLKARAQNGDRLSVDGDLFPLSAYFGVCVRGVSVWNADLRSGMASPHYPTDAGITLAGGAKLNVSVGKFGLWPGTTLHEVAAINLPRRIQRAEVDGTKSLLVSGFAGAGDTRVSIGFDSADVQAYPAAVRFANSVISCQLSASAAAVGRAP